MRTGVCACSCVDVCVSMWGTCTCVLVNCKCPSFKTVYLVFPADFCQWPGDYQIGQAVWPAALGIHLPLSPALELHIHATNIQLH